MGRIDPESIGLKSTEILEAVGKEGVAIVKNRKSRILMKDGEKIIEIAEKIAAKTGKKKIFLKTNAPVCSKTIQLLEREGIGILSSVQKIQ